jgi:hypothetical protein
MYKYIILSITFILFNSNFIFAQYDYPITLDSISEIELTENRDEMSGYLANIDDNYGDDHLFIIVLFDVKNDAKSLGKFKKLVKDSILNKTNDVPVKFILQPIPTEYKYTDIKTKDDKNYAMPTHNMLIYYKKDKLYLDEFTNRMQAATQKMNIWKLNKHEIDKENGSYIFERIKYGGSCLPDEEELMLKCLMPLFDELKVTKSKLKRVESELLALKKNAGAFNSEIKLKGDSIVKLKRESILPPKGFNINLFRNIVSFNSASLSNATLGYDKIKIESNSINTSLRANYPLFNLTRDKKMFLEVGLGFDYGRNRLSFSSEDTISYQIDYSGYSTNVSLTRITEALNMSLISIPLFAKLNYKITDKLSLSNSIGIKYQIFTNASISRNEVYGSFTRQYSDLSFVIENNPQMGLQNNVLMPIDENEIKIKPVLIAENLTYISYNINPFIGVYCYLGLEFPFKYNFSNNAEYISERPEDYHNILSLKESKITALNRSFGLGFKINL